MNETIIRIGYDDTIATLPIPKYFPKNKDDCGAVNCKCGYVLFFPKPMEPGVYLIECPVCDNEINYHTGGKR